MHREEQADHEAGEALLAARQAEADARGRRRACRRVGGERRSAPARRAAAGHRRGHRRLAANAGAAAAVWRLGRQQAHRVGTPEARTTAARRDHREARCRQGAARADQGGGPGRIEGMGACQGGRRPGFQRAATGSAQLRDRAYQVQIRRRRARRRGRHGGADRDRPDDRPLRARNPGA